MRRATVAAVLLGLLAIVSAGDVSKPKHGDGRLSCLLPIAKLQCIRDWRSGFVAGLKYSYAEFDSQGDPTVPTTSGTRNRLTEQWMQVCSPSTGNQTLFDMSALEGPQSIGNAQTSPNGAPAWYARTPTRPDVHYFYPRGAPITQIIVLKASNPWGDSFGTIPAVLFGYIRDDGELDFAVCGNAVYANAFLRPATAPAPPTPVSLKSSHTSGLSEGDHFTSLSSFEGKCGVRGQGFSSYLGGDPNTSTKFPIKALKKPCFTKWDNKIVPWESTQPPPLQRIWGHFDCANTDTEVCTTPCHFNKKTNKKGPSYSCDRAGVALAVGKYGPIEFNDDEMLEWDRDDAGAMVKVKTAASPTADFEEEEKEEKKN